MHAPNAKDADKAFEDNLEDQQKLFDAFNEERPHQALRGNDQKMYISDHLEPCRVKYQK